MNEIDLKKRTNEFMKGFPTEKYYTHKAVEDILFSVLKVIYEDRLTQNLSQVSK